MGISNPFLPGSRTPLIIRRNVQTLPRNVFQAYELQSVRSHGVLTPRPPKGADMDLVSPSSHVLGLTPLLTCSCPSFQTGVVFPLVWPGKLRQRWAESPLRMPNCLLSWPVWGHTAASLAGMADVRVLAWCRSPGPGVQSARVRRCGDLRFVPSRTL